MAVIKEQKQFKIGSIGVARASEGSTIIGNAVTNSMTKLAGIAADEATFHAAKTGIEEGSKVVTIDPMTGMPNALDVPTGFGRLAAEAYTRTAMTRFDRSIETEIKLKSAELSVKYEKSGNAAVLYEKAMKDYIDSMTDAASEAYKPVVADKGLEYIAITTYNLAEAQRQRELNAAIAAHAETSADALESILNMRSQLGPSREGEKGPVEHLIESAEVHVENGLQAKFYDENQNKKFNEEIVTTNIMGNLTYLINQEADPTKLALLQSAILTNNPNAIPKGYEAIKEAMIALGSDLTSKGKVADYARTVIPARMVTANIITAKANAKIKQELETFNATLIVSEETTGLATEKNYAQVGSGVLLNPPSRNSNSPPQITSGQFVTKIMEEHKGAQQQAISLIAQGDSPAATAVLNEQGHIARGAARGLGTALFRNLNVDEISNMIQAIKTGDYSNINPIRLQILEGIQTLALVGPDESKVQSDFDTFLKETAENTDLFVRLEMMKREKEDGDGTAEAFNDGKSFHAATGEITQRILAGYEEEIAQIQDFELSGYNKSAKDAQDNLDAKLISFVNGAIANILDNNGKGLTVKQVQELTEATISKDSSKLGPKAKAIFDRTLLKVQEETGIDAMSMLKTIADTYKSSGAKLVTQKLEEEAEVLVKTLVPFITDLSAVEFESEEGSDTNSIEIKTSLLENKVNSILNLNKTIKDNHLSEIRQNGAKAYLSNLFSIDAIKLKDGQIEIAEGILSGGINIGEGENQLSKAQVAFLKRARALGEKGGKTSELKTHFNALKEGRKKEIIEESKDELRRRELRDLFQGQLEASSSKAQSIVSEVIEDSIGISNLYESLQDRGFFSTPEGKQVAELIQISGVLPTEIIDMFENLAEGALNNINAEAALDIFSNFKNYTYLGSVLASKAMSGIDPKVEATLEVLAVATQITGNSNKAISGIILRVEEQGKPDLKAFRAKKTADLLNLDLEEKETVTTWMLENIDAAAEIPQSYLPSLRVFAETLIDLSIKNPNLYTKKHIIRSLNEHIEKKFPDPLQQNNSVFKRIKGNPGSTNPLSYVVHSTDIGTGRRTGATLAQSVQGNEQEFINTVEKMIRGSDGVSASDEIHMGPKFKLGSGGSRATDFQEAFTAGTYFLMPTSPMMSGYVEYQIMQITDEIGGSRPVMKTETFYEVDGRKATQIKVPMFINNRDPNFLALTKLKAKGMSVANLEAAMLSRKRREEKAAGLNATDLPINFDIGDPSTYFSTVVNGIINTYENTKFAADQARKVEE